MTMSHFFSYLVYSLYYCSTTVCICNQVGGSLVRFEISLCLVSNEDLQLRADSLERNGESPV